jgi:hypothetical protein
LYSDTFAALKACSRIDPDWLELAIRDADPAKHPVHDLAYLVSTLRDAGLWRRCKRRLMSKVDNEHQRSIATCIFTFRDASEQEWLAARVSEPKDLLGPVALRALAAIAPDRALQTLDQLDDRVLASTRQWCFFELHARLPDEVVTHFAERVRKHPNPWKYARVLQGNEDIIDPETFDFLLDRMTELLEAVVRVSATEKIAVLRTALAFVKTVARPDLLDRLRCRRGSGLETVLADWLIALGPQSGSWRQHDKHAGLDALARIGGEGFIRVLNDWLERGDDHAKMHAAELARRRASPRTIELLTELSRTGGQADDGDLQYFVQGRAAAALATHRCWTPLADYFLRVGVQSLTTVKECCPAPEEPVDDVNLGEAIAQMRSMAPPSPGAVLAVAVSGRNDLLPRIRVLLKEATPGSDLATACLIAVHWLADADPQVVPALVRHLPTSTHHATVALLSNGSPAASEALLAELRRKPDIELAAILANQVSCREAAIDAIRRALAGDDRLQLQRGLPMLVARLTPDALRAAADCRELFALAEDVGYGPYEPSSGVGEKPAALRVVAQRDPESALRLAIARLRDPETPDGELYVPLMADLNPGRAASTLFDVAMSNPTNRVIWAIGHALRRLNATPAVRSWLNDPANERRLAACRVAGSLPPTDDLIAASKSDWAIRTMRLQRPLARASSS